MRVVAGLTLLGTMLAATPGAEVCAPAPRAEAMVAVEGEEAIIVWDAAKGDAARRGSHPGSP